MLSLEIDVDGLSASPLLLGWLGDEICEDERDASQERSMRKMVSPDVLLPPRSQNPKG